MLVSILFEAVSSSFIDYFLFLVIVIDSLTASRQPGNVFVLTEFRKEPILRCFFWDWNQNSLRMRKQLSDSLTYNLLLIISDIEYITIWVIDLREIILMFLI